MASRRGSGDDARIARLDAAASAALSSVGADAASQLSALSALSTLSASLPEDGLLRELVLGFARERRAAFVAFHEASLGRATSESESSSSSGSPSTASAFAEALAFTIGLEGDGEAAAALRALRDHNQPSTPGAAPSDPSSSSSRVASGGLPRPFFARFLAHQER
jgi:hypothetical protein